jgi:hypothetical protein
VTVSQLRVQKQRPVRRRAQETSTAEQRHADRRSGVDRRADDRASTAKIYDWLALPTWRGNQ